MFQDEAKCTLMSNEPKADIELLFPGDSACSRKRSDATVGSRSKSASPNMRIRLSRKAESVEMARHIVGIRGGEWTKKLMAATSQGGKSIIKEADWGSLQSPEKKGMECLAMFLRVCEAVESVGEPRGMDDGHSWQTKIDGSLSGNGQPVEIVDSNGTPSLVRLQDSTGKNTLAAYKVVPRPRKLSPQPTEQVAGGGRLHGHTESQILPSIVEPMKSWRSENAATNSAIGATSIQTRFIPSVGWCIRYGRESGMLGGGKYQIVFLDGAALDIDVDRESVELKNALGDVVQ